MLTSEGFKSQKPCLILLGMPSKCEGAAGPNTSCPGVTGHSHHLPLLLTLSSLFRVLLEAPELAMICIKCFKARCGYKLFYKLSWRLLTKLPHTNFYYLLEKTKTSNFLTLLPLYFTLYLDSYIGKKNV